MENEEEKELIDAYSQKSEEPKIEIISAENSSSANIPKNESANNYYEHILNVTSNITFALGMIATAYLFFTKALDKDGINAIGLAISLSTCLSSFLLWAGMHVLSNISTSLKKNIKS